MRSRFQCFPRDTFGNKVVDNDIFIEAEMLMTTLIYTAFEQQGVLFQLVLLSGCDAFIRIETLQNRTHFRSISERILFLSTNSASSQCFVPLSSFQAEFVNMDDSSAPALRPEHQHSEGKNRP